MKKSYIIIIVIVASLVIVLNLSKNGEPTPSVSEPIDNMYVEEVTYPENYKGILLELNIIYDQLTLIEQELVNGFPNYLKGKYPFIAQILSLNGEMLGEYGFNDPRVVLAERGYKGPTWRENVDFTLILPYFDNGKTINIYSEEGLLLFVNI